MFTLLMSSRASADRPKVIPSPIRKGVMPMFADTIPKPNEKQILFFKARQRHIGYGGA